MVPNPWQCIGHRCSGEGASITIFQVSSLLGGNATIYVLYTPPVPSRLALPTKVTSVHVCHVFTLEEFETYARAHLQDATLKWVHETIAQGQIIRENISV